MTSTRVRRSHVLIGAIGMMGLFTLQFAAQQARAANKLWDNVEGGFFDEPLNWFGGVPGTEDVARFETTNSNFFQRTYTVDFHTDPINQQLVVEDDAVTFNLMGHAYELTNPFVAAALGTVAIPERSGDLTVINGTLKLPTGATLEIASVADSKGSLTVGAGGTIENSDLGGDGPDVKVGVNDNGTLEISNGGTVRARNVTLGVNSGSTGTVKITSGGRLSTRGVNSGSTGTVIVTGNGSRLLILGDLDMRGAGSGTFRIEAGGSVNADNVHLGDNDALHLEGGSLHASIMNNSPSFIWTSGLLSFRQFDDDLTIPNGGVLGLSGFGLLADPDLVNGNLTLLPGATTQGFLGEISGVAFGPYVVHVDEHMVIDGGNLQVILGEFLGEVFTPSPEDKFEIITTGLGISGSFANVANGQRLAVGHGSFVVNYGQGSPFKPTSVFLSSFQPATLGDFDVDGDVDGNDFLVWQRGGSPNGGNAADLVAWRVNFGTSGTAAANGAVPEPSGEWIARAAIALACAFRKRSGRGL